MPRASGVNLRRFVVLGPCCVVILAELPPEHREALLARVVDGRDYAEIAAELRCSEQLVRQRVNRGLGRLRQALQGGRT